MLHNAPTYIFAALSAIAATALATWQIVNHIQHYSSPIFQRYILRIIFMVPVYSVCSFLALVRPHDAVYFETVRVIYEAFVIYTFLSLCLEFVGGPGEVEVKMNGFVLHPSFLHCTCCFPPQRVDGLFVRRCKQGALQFVLLMPILGILSVVLYATGNYSPGYWGPSNGYLYITIVYNVTYSVALLALFMFYMGAHDLLAPFNPLLKFVLVKSVVFFTFWQGILIAILVGTGVIDNAEDGSNLQNLLVCLEMLPAAIGMFYAFPYQEFKDGAPGAGGAAVGNAMHAISIHDVASDTVHQFAPTYRNYVLYSDKHDDDSKPDEAPKRTFRAKTFVPVEAAQAMQGTEEKPKSSLLQNMEMGNAAFWDSNGEAGSAAPNGTADSDQQQASPAAAGQPAAQPQAPAMNGASTSSARPDLTYVNDESVAPRVPPEGAAPQPPQQQQPPQRSASGAPAWADVDL
jgi:hypothetical protein